MVWRSTRVPVAELTDGAPRGTNVGPQPILLVREGATVLALDGSCPHLGAELSEGSVENGRLTCPLHGAVFDLATGAVRADPFGRVPPEGGVGPLASFPVRLADGIVEVDLPEL